MSFRKTEQLLALANFVASRRHGVTLEDVIARLSVSKRTAQRILRALETQFLDTETSTDDQGRKRWRLPPAALRDLMTLSPEELAALDLALETFKRDGLTVEHDDLRALREKILALVPRSKVARLETDHEALLEAQGLAARPGPRQRFDREVAEALSQAIKACRILEVHYKGRGDHDVRTRRLAPYGLITGLRRYLIAKVEHENAGTPKLFVVENIARAVVTATPFDRDPAFNLHKFSTRAFGVYQNEEEYGEVVWRFSARAAERARNFEFHPQQCVEEQADGTLIVRFSAAGHLEMAWHLYVWGADVEVLAPEKLRNMVEGYRRDDFPAFP